MNKFFYVISVFFVTLLWTMDVQAWGDVKTEIYRAASAGKTDILQSYINRGYSIDTADKDGVTALCSAYFNRDYKAYNLLLQYGANPHVRCMSYTYDTASNASSLGLKMSSTTKYALGGALIVGAGAGIVAVAGGGSGGGGSSSHASQNDENTGGETGGSTGGETGGSTGGETSGSTGGETGGSTGGETGGSTGGETGGSTGGETGGSTGGETGGSTGGETGGSTGGETGGSTGGETGGSTGGETGGSTGGETGGSTGNGFDNNKEYTGALLDHYNGSAKSSVNYLGSINAAAAYAALKNVTLDTVNVGVLDSGVWGNHPEFSIGNGQSKVSGYNYDYGPCRGGDTSHCWALLVINSTSYLVLYGDSGSVVDTYADLSEEEVDEAMQWMASYPADYNWDSAAYHNYYYPNSYQVINDTSLMHGTNVAGIIAANKNDVGSMGVAYDNARITAIRWDFYTSSYAPLKKFLDDGVFAVNLSLGVDANDDLNASKINDVSTGWGTNYLKAIREIIQANSVKNGHVDGMILVKAAGNENYSQPDIQSGVKLLDKSFGSVFSPHYYNEIQMVVVTSVDVSLDANGQISGYKLSNFSNQCGVTKDYCISAPGGNTNATNTYTTKALYAPGESYTDNRYYGMAGTSQATPVVTGSLAYLKGAYPYLTSSELIELIMVTANKNSTDTYRPEKYGAGLLDLGAAVSTYISDERNSFSLSTFTGGNTQSEKLSLDDAKLSVPSSMQTALLKALPKTITAFDKFNRPFAFATDRFVQKTHGSYKSFKNDVKNVAQRKKIEQIKQNNFSFAFNEFNRQTDPYAWKYMDVSYQYDRQEFGFYFKENTSYAADDYFKSSMHNPFMSFNNAYGVRHSYGLTSGSMLQTEAVFGRNGLYDGEYDYHDGKFNQPSYALNTTFMLYKNDQYQFGISSGILTEDEALLGMNGSGAFAIDKSQTFHSGLTASWFVTPKLSLSGSYYQGYTQGRSFGSGLLKTSDLVSESFALDANYQWDKLLNFGLQLSSPLRIRKGTLSVDFPKGRDQYSEKIYREKLKASLKPNDREYRFDFYMNKEVSQSLNWRFETGVRIHPEHNNSTNDYRAIVGLNWTFN